MRWRNEAGLAWSPLWTCGCTGLSWTPGCQPSDFPTRRTCPVSLETSKKRKIYFKSTSLAYYLISTPRTKHTLTKAVIAQTRDKLTQLFRL